MPRYTINPQVRIAEITGKSVIPDTAELSYSFDQGYERLSYRNSSGEGRMSYEGAYHPNAVCEGESVCRYCGRVF